jgi:hypothetical protein
MKINFKKIHLGELIKKRVDELSVDTSRICMFLKCTEDEVTEMYKAKSIDSDILLRWSKLLEYDFFRLYSQHLILYAPPSVNPEKNNKIKTRLPIFKKNIYTRELIDFILERIRNKEMTKLQVIEEYKIPKTTLYKWISKYEVSHNN